MKFPDLGSSVEHLGLVAMDRTSDSVFSLQSSDVQAIGRTRDGKVEFVGLKKHTLALVNSAMGTPAYYPVPSISCEMPLKAVLMDLDGTTVRSEKFWIWIIQSSIASLLGNSKFELEDEDVPFVSGHSVSEHLQYCINKYCPQKTVEEARMHYNEHTCCEMRLILEGKGRQDTFQPVAGTKDFLLELKALGLKVGLVTSGLYEKAYPTIVSAFNSMAMGDPVSFYDAIITAGFPMRKGKQAGTLGELSPKPHPWLYAEALRIGLGIENRHEAIGIEDSGAGVCSIRLAGMRAYGMSGGNITASGTRGLCHNYFNSFEGALSSIKENI